MNPDTKLNLTNLTEDFYLEGDLVIFTERFLLKRGACCQNQCRHCPWKEKRIISSEQ
ncbi:MAG: DUF5522 domain-containing protein [Elusimicrobiota bacterium]